MNTKLKTCAALLAAAMTTSANAGVVTEWTYNNQAGFDFWIGETDTTSLGDDVSASGNSATGVDGDPLANQANNILDTDGDFDVDGDDTALHTSLSWGTPGNGWQSGDPQSSLDIESPITGSITTNDYGWADGTSIFHENWVITGDSLLGAHVLDGLTLTPTAWTTEAGDDETILTDNAPYFAPQLQFGVRFFETPNGVVDQDNNCPDGQARGVGNNVAGCGDIFELTGLQDLPFAPVVGEDFIEFTVPFVLMGQDGLPMEGWSDTVYYVTTRLSGLQTLPEEYECESVLNQITETCYGFVTVENQTNELLAQFKIRTVPEPAAIALFGLGLLATGFAGRRRRQA